MENGCTFIMNAPSRNDTHLWTLNLVLFTARQTHRANIMIEVQRLAQLHQCNVRIHSCAIKSWMHNVVLHQSFLERWNHGSALQDKLNAFQVYAVVWSHNRQIQSNCVTVFSTIKLFAYYHCNGFRKIQQWPHFVIPSSPACKQCLNGWSILSLRQTCPLGLQRTVPMVSHFSSLN